jgi:polar amino acid transport system substrate-binding protein
MIRGVTTLLFLLLLTYVTVLAQPQGEKLRVATRLVKPFVFEETGRLTGFSIDLWEEIAKQLNVSYEYVVRPTVKDLLQATQSKEADLAIAAISITAEREKGWDFSQPMFDAGLQIMVSTHTSEGAFVRNIISDVFTASILPLLGLVLLMILVPAHVVWFFERRHPNGILSKPNYFPGIFETAWWAASTLATQADQMPRSAAARIMAVIWMFAAVVFIAYFTAAVTSSLTLQQLRGDIRGPEDLPGKRIASVKGSTSVEYLRQHNVQVTEFTNIDEAYKTLHGGETDAVVYDAPVLLYYASREGKGKVMVVGPVFRKENYGILFPAGSRYRKPINEALLKTKETGTYEQLYKKWFGPEG